METLKLFSNKIILKTSSFGAMQYSTLHHENLAIFDWEIVTFHIQNIKSALISSEALYINLIAIFLQQRMFYATF